MRAVVQRVLRAAVDVPGAGGRVEVGRIGRGLVVLVGARRGDTDESAVRLADKVWRLRVFETEHGERSAADLALPVLVVSQFTLHADTGRGRRPSWAEAAPATEAEALVDGFARALREAGAVVETGQFGAHMRIEMVADGPLTILLEV